MLTLETIRFTMLNKNTSSLHYRKVKIDQVYFCSGKTQCSSPFSYLHYNGLIITGRKNTLLLFVSWSHKALCRTSSSSQVNLFELGNGVIRPTKLLFFLLRVEALFVSFRNYPSELISWKSIFFLPEGGTVYRNVISSPWIVFNIILYLNVNIESNRQEKKN